MVKKAPKTRRDNAKQLEKIRAVFGEMPLTALKPKHIYQYADKRGKLVAAKREIALLSHAYTKAVEWGYISQHPFKGEIRLEGEKPRTRYVEDWEIIEALSLKTNWKAGSIIAVQAYITLKLLTGLRKSDMLRLQMSDCKEDGIHVLTKKTGKTVIYTWTDELREAVDMALSARPVDISPFLFCNRWGQSYVNEDQGTTGGWNSIWQRFMKRVLEETKVEERFTEHDLRAKCASDVDDDEHARKLLAHSSVKLTRRVYRRKPEKVKPAK